jgi:D-ribose pyranose/furanose isomerase RbsD
MVKNQPRDVDNLSETYPPYCAFIPHFVNGRAVSIVEQLQSLQNLKDIIIYNIQLAMARAGAKGFVYDVSQCPDGWEPETVIKYLKTVGIAFIDSRQGGTPAQFNQFQQIDLSLSASVSQYLELSAMVDREMDSISGINEARQGVMQGASQLASVTQSALLQSSLTTSSYFRLFEQFNSNIWNQLAKLVKISWAGKEKYASIIGDAGVNFLEQDIELDLNDYAVFVESTPKILDDKNQFNALIMAGIQSGEVKLADALKLLMEKDVITAIGMFEKMSRKREKEAIAQAQQHDMQMQQMKQESTIAAQEKMNQYNQETSRQAAEKAAALQDKKDSTAKEIELIKSRTKLASDRINTLNQQEITKLRG